MRVLIGITYCKYVPANVTEKYAETQVFDLYMVIHFA